MIKCAAKVERSMLGRGSEVSAAIRGGVVRITVLDRTNMGILYHHSFNIIQRGECRRS
jgi:hypothetical protein